MPIELSRSAFKELSETAAVPSSWTRMFPLSTFCSVTGTGSVDVLPMITFVNGVAASAIAPLKTVPPSKAPAVSSDAVTRILRMSLLSSGACCRPDCAHAMPAPGRSKGGITL